MHDKTWEQPLTVNDCCQLIAYSNNMYAHSILALCIHLKAGRHVSFSFIMHTTENANANAAIILHRAIESAVSSQTPPSHRGRVSACVARCSGAFLAVHAMVKFLRIMHIYKGLFTLHPNSVLNAVQM